MLYNTSVGDSGGLEGEDVADDPDRGREGLFDGGVEVMLRAREERRRDEIEETTVSWMLNKPTSVVCPP